jgi:hypothetical protein
LSCGRSRCDRSPHKRGSVEMLCAMGITLLPYDVIARAERWHKKVGDVANRFYFTGICSDE